MGFSNKPTKLQSVLRSNYLGSFPWTEGRCRRPTKSPARERQNHCSTLEAMCLVGIPVLEMWKPVTNNQQPQPPINLWLRHAKTTHLQQHLKHLGLVLEETKTQVLCCAFLMVVSSLCRKHSWLVSSPANHHLVLYARHPPPRSPYTIAVHEYIQPDSFGRTLLTSGPPGSQSIQRDMLQNQLQKVKAQLRVMIFHLEKPWNKPDLEGWTIANYFIFGWYHLIYTSLMTYRSSSRKNVKQWSLSSVASCLKKTAFIGPNVLQSLSFFGFKSIEKNFVKMNSFPWWSMVEKTLFETTIHSSAFWDVLRVASKYPVPWGQQFITRISLVVSRLQFS